MVRTRHDAAATAGAHNYRITKLVQFRNKFYQGETKFCLLHEILVDLESPYRALEMLLTKLWETGQSNLAVFKRSTNKLHQLPSSIDS